MSESAQPDVKMSGSVDNKSGDASLGSKKSFPFFHFILLVVIVIGLLVGSDFLEVFSRPDNLPKVTGKIQNIKSKLPIGVNRAQKLIAEGGKLVTDSATQIRYRGTLKNFEAGKSWTIGINGKQLTIAHEGKTPVNYFRLGQNSVRQTVDAKVLKAGDLVSIITDIDTKTGVVSVESIIILPKPKPEASGSAVPAPKTP